MTVLERFADNLQKTTYCTNDLLNGLKLNRKSNALKKHYLALNTKYLHYLSFDIDYAGVDTDWLNLPPATIKTNNNQNGHCHLLYELITPIINTDIAKRKPLRFYADVESKMSALLKADANYTHLITKNPLSKFWACETIDVLYDLEELNEYLPSKIIYQEKKEISGFSRNCDLFDVVRLMAYRQVKHCANEVGLYNYCLEKLNENNSFTTPLNYNELKGIAKSISKWT